MNPQTDQNDAMQRFQAALRQSASQYGNAQLEAQLRAEQQAPANQQYQLQQRQVQVAAATQSMQLGALIRSRRMALNADPHALAQFCGINDPQIVFDLENGNSGEISFSSVLLVMQALGLQLSAFPQV
jgi:DNA-binding phage protein